MQYFLESYLGNKQISDVQMEQTLNEAKELEGVHSQFLSPAGCLGPGMHLHI